MLKKSPSKSEFLLEFLNTSSDNQKALFESVVDKYLHAQEAFQEVDSMYKQMCLNEQNFISHLDIINAAFRRIGAPDRIKTVDELGSVVANFLWKQQCLSNVQPAQDVPKMEKIPDKTT